MQRNGEAEAGNERKRVRRIDRQRRQQRENVVEEVILDPGPFRLGDVTAIDHDNPGPGQIAAKIAPDCLLVGGEPRDCLVDDDELLGRGQTIGTAFKDTFANLRLDTRDADHEEFIKVIGGNRQEAHALQQRVTGVDRFFKHTPIEMQPGQFAIDKAIRAARDRGTGFYLRYFIFNNNGLCGIHEKLVHPGANAASATAAVTNHVLST